MESVYTFRVRGSRITFDATGRSLREATRRAAFAAGRFVLWTGDVKPLRALRRRKARKGRR